MTARDKDDIKLFFQKGDKPTEGQFADLIDSYVDKTGPVGTIETAVSAGGIGFGYFSGLSGSLTPYSTTAQAQAGTNTTSVMNPSTVKSAIDALGPADNSIDVDKLATSLKGVNASLRSRNFRILVCSGQSNALGNNSGGDTAVNNKVLAWDSVAGATVVAELGQEPFRSTGENNMFLQAARHIQDIEGDDITVYMVLVAQGGLSINHWLQETFTVTNVTNANPGVVTYTGDPGILNSNQVTFSSVGGMTELNGNTYTAANIDLDNKTFELSGTDTTSFGTYTSGGTFVFATDLYADIKTQTAALLSYLGLPSTTEIDAFMWMQGESDDAYIDFYTYSNAVNTLIGKLESEDWYGEQSKFIACQVAENQSGDRVNNGLRDLTTTGDNQNIFLVDSQFEPTDDGVHFTGAALTTIGKKIGKTFIGGGVPRIWIPKRVIDRQVSVEIPNDFDDLNIFEEWISRWEFSGLGEMIVYLTDDITVDSAIQWRHPQGERVLIQGAFKTGKTAPPVAGDFSGTRATDLTNTVEAFYEYRINASGVSPFIIGPNSGIRLSTVAIVGDSTNAALAIDMRDQLSRVGQNTLGLEDCMIFGFDGSTSYGIRGNFSSIHELSSSGLVIAHTDRAIWIENNSKVKLNDYLSMYNTYGLYSIASKFEIPNCDIRNSTTYDVYSELSQGNVESGNLTGAGTNAIRCRKGGYVYAQSATLGGTSSPTTSTDGAGATIVQI